MWHEQSPRKYADTIKKNNNKQKIRCFCITNLFMKNEKKDYNGDGGHVQEDGNVVIENGRLREGGWGYGK